MQEKAALKEKNEALLPVNVVLTAVLSNVTPLTPQHPLMRWNTF